MPPLPPDLQEILDHIGQNEQDARNVLAGLSPQQLNQQPSPGKSWSILQCFHHLALINSEYLGRMKPVLDAADAANTPRRGPIQLSLAARLIISSIEPPVRMKLPAPPASVPASILDPDPTLNSWLATHIQLGAIAKAGATLDLNKLKFPNPFIKQITMRFGTALLLLMAHERRHILQASQVRRQLGVG